MMSKIRMRLLVWLENHKEVAKFLECIFRISFLPLRMTLAQIREIEEGEQNEKRSEYDFTVKQDQ